jgi:molecular chaperone GrpE
MGAAIMSSEQEQKAQATSPPPEEIIRRLQGDVRRLEKELEEKTKLAEHRLNQLRYLQADFDNYRKYYEKEKQEIIDMANENLIKELLVIIDDFERALQSIEGEKDKQGMAFIYRNFLKILESHGLKQIEALNMKFDPNLHEAVLKEVSEKDDGTIIEEIQKGFTFKGKVLRPSKVKVSSKA